MMDSPNLPTESGRDEQKNVSWRSLSLETQLWIEVSILIGFGLVMIYSASSILAVRKFGDAAFYLKRQCLSVGMGLVTLVVFSRWSYRDVSRYLGWMLLFTVIALALVLIPGIGEERNHARRWFKLAGLLVQPAEYAKVIWALFLGTYLSRKQEKIHRFAVGFLGPMAICGVISILLLKEPDFGTTFIIACLTMVMMAVAGVRFRYLIFLVPVAALGFYKFVVMVAWRWERITAFLDPWSRRLDTGYQLIQAWIAVGSGGFFGKGLGAGQQKLFYLPESYTDFIMAVVGEELGFLGIALVCALFFFFFRTGMKISRQAPDNHGSILACGLTMLLCLQALVNMAVVLGLIPTKGLPLPFISYGGSAFTANCMAVGMLMNIARSGERQAR